MILRVSIRLVLGLLLYINSLQGQSQANYTGINFDLVIINGRIIDGAGNPWYRANIGIKDGRIQAIGQFPYTSSTKIIDAKNQIVAPGFIDVHVHVENNIQKIPTADNYLQAGVTSIITGNCGSSETNLKAFFEELDSLTISINLGSLVGHGSIRKAVLGEVDREPTAEEQVAMENLVQKAMEDGALGLSTGLVYIPGAYAATEEILGLTKVIAPYEGVYTSHIRNEGLKVIPSLQEAIDIGEAANVPVQISHLKIMAKPLWGKSDTLIQMIESARKEGVDVTADQYPYTASSTNLAVMLPKFAFDGGLAAFRDRIKKPEEKAKIMEGMLKMLQADARENYDYVVIANYAGDASYNGKSIHQLNLDLGRPDQVEAEMELILEMLAAHGRPGNLMVFHRMAEPDVERILTYPHTMIAGDAIVENLGNSAAHPRAYGTNARVFRRYVREKKVVSLENAVRRMTSLPARRFGLRDRGLLLEGYVADIVIFDENAMMDHATFAKPHAFSTGCSYVFVNGVLTVEKGQHTQAKAGQILRNK